MSANRWGRLLASAEGLLTEEDCFLLLDSDFLDTADDLLRNFPSAAPKPEVGAYSLHDDVSASMYPPSPPEIKPSRAELANDILQQLDNECKQENIFPNWLEEKVELPIFDNMSRVEPTPPSAVLVPLPAPAYSAPQPTEELLREFENVYDAVELTHLTPPQSPPGPATQLLLSYAQQHAPTVSVEGWHAPPPAHYDTELASVEELVRARAAQLVAPHSPASSSRSSPPSSPRSSATDEEWSAPSRGKPYSRSPDDRRSRKKEQNKNAATRYRQKKKAEIEVLLTEEQKLRQKHTELGDRCSDLQREIRYLKGLMRDLFEAKGLIK